MIRQQPGFVQQVDGAGAGQRQVGRLQRGRLGHADRSTTQSGLAALRQGCLQQLTHRRRAHQVGGEAEGDHLAAGRITGAASELQKAGGRGRSHHPVDPTILQVAEGASLHAVEAHGRAVSGHRSCQRKSVVSTAEGVGDESGAVEARRGDGVLQQQGAAARIQAEIRSLDRTAAQHRGRRAGVNGCLIGRQWLAGFIDKDSLVIDPVTEEIHHVSSGGGVQLGIGAQDATGGRHLQGGGGDGGARYQAGTGLQADAWSRVAVGVAAGGAKRHGLQEAATGCIALITLQTGDVEAFLEAEATCLQGEITAGGVDAGVERPRTGDAAVDGHRPSAEAQPLDAGGASIGGELKLQTIAQQELSAGAGQQTRQSKHGDIVIAEGGTSLQAEGPGRLQPDRHAAAEEAPVRLRPDRHSEQPFGGIAHLLDLGCGAGVHQASEDEVVAGDHRQLPGAAGGTQVGQQRGDAAGADLGGREFLHRHVHRRGDAAGA